MTTPNSTPKFRSQKYIFLTPINNTKKKKNTNFVRTSQMSSQPTKCHALLPLSGYFVLTKGLKARTHTHTHTPMPPL